MLPLLFGAVSLLYATVGQAGGTAFLALMAFASFIVLDERIYNTVTGFVLILAAFILVMRRPRDRGIGSADAAMGRNHRRRSGRFRVWAHRRRWRRISCPDPYRLALGVPEADGSPVRAALAGAMIGTTAGLRWLSQTATRYAL